MAPGPSDDDLFNTTDGSDKGLEDISWDDLSAETDKRKTDVGGTDDAKKPAEFSELKKTGVVAAPSNLDFILDIPLEVTVELGRTTMPIYDLLQLGRGSIIELNKMAGEPLEILVNQKLIAKGEVVVVNEKFGIRLTDVISPKERIEKLG
ncbi:MAG: flagellar motor switch protein FliN [Desulfobacterota bacterium]|nr:flagellar motor switch protein FliN [Thermodesulfobacteriota bacterium]